MIRVNLLGTDRARAAQPRARMNEAQKITLACALIMLLAAGYIGWQFWSIQTESAAVDTQLYEAELEAQRLRDILSQVQKFEAQKAQLQQRVTLIEQLRAGQIGPVHMLDEVSRALPDRVWLVELSQKAEEVTIEGRTTSLTALTDFVANLQNSPYFRRPVEIVTTQTETDAQGELVRFVVRGAFMPGGGAATAPTAVAATAGR